MDASVYKLAVSGVSGWYAPVGAACGVMPVMVMPAAAARSRSWVMVVIRGEPGGAAVMPWFSRSGMVRPAASLMGGVWRARSTWLSSAYVIFSFWRQAAAATMAA